MPILNVKVSGTKSAEMTKRSSPTFQDLTTRILRKDPKVTSIAIEYVDPQQWIVAGKSLVEQGKPSFYSDIKVTDEVNSRSVKALYIGSAFEAFAEILGKVPEESYIYVQDVRASAYGYGGRTQEYRYQHA